MRWALGIDFHFLLLNYNHRQRARQAQDHHIFTLAKLFRDDGFSSVEHGRCHYPREDVRQLLTSGVQFVVPKQRAAPRWIPEGDCFRFWKDETKTHLATDAKVRLAEVPD
jgi:hypothetical protein